MNELLHKKDKPVDNFPSDFCTRLSACFLDKIINLQQLITLHIGNSNRTPFIYDKCSRDQPLADFRPVTPAEVKKLVNTINLKNSPIDSFPAILLKKCPDVFAKLISRLANLSFIQNRFPQIYKISHVVPLIKKAGLDKFQPLSYRPISNLNTISKLLERLAIHQLGMHI